MIDKFIVGHYYIYMGNARPDGWNSFGQMDYLLKHTAQKCIDVTSNNGAQFENDPANRAWYFSTENMQLFIDVTRKQFEFMF